MAGVSYNTWFKVTREIFPTSVNFECTRIVEYNISLNETREIRFKVGGKNDDKKRDLKFELNNSNISLSTSYWTVENEWVIKTNVTGKKLGETLITVKVEGKTLNTIKIRCINYKDVFSEVDVKRLINEINYIKPFADAGTAPEYDENYCMQAAERGLSELLQNTIDFYSVDRNTHKHKNRIGFSGLTAVDRGNKIKSNGFVIRNWKFNEYAIDHSKRDIINGSKTSNEASTNYADVRYDIVTLAETKKNKLLNNFKQDIANQIGFHVYYFCITGGFHTLLLVIDNSNPCNINYTIYDQHGPTSSKGKFEELGEGLRKQTSWTFANTCMNRLLEHLKKKNNKHLKWDSTETVLWKIQRK